MRAGWQEPRPPGIFNKIKLYSEVAYLFKKNDFSENVEVVVIASSETFTVSHVFKDGNKLKIMVNPE
jgi:hypothetical protein